MTKCVLGCVLEFVFEFIFTALSKARVLKNKIHRLFAVPVVLILGLLFMVPWAAAEHQQKEAWTSQPWHQFETDHFIFITDLKSESAAKVVQRLRQFHLAIEQGAGILSSAQMRKKARPLTLILTEHDSTYDFLTQHAPQLRKTSGFFRDSINGPYCVLRYVKTSQNHAALLHEYTHYVLANSTYSNAPYWYREGLAEYLAHTQFKRDDSIVYGRIAKHHVKAMRTMRWVPSKEMLTAKYVSRRLKKRHYQTYSQGWLMAHYFHSNADRQQQLRQYLSLSAAGMAEQQALQYAVGLSFSELDTELRRYLKKGIYKKRAKSIRPIVAAVNVSVTAKQLRTNEVMSALGLFFLQSEAKPELAKPLFERALRLNLNNAHALAGLANIALFARNKSSLLRAQGLINQALKLAPQAPFVNTVSGHVFRQKIQFANTRLEQEAFLVEAASRYNIAMHAAPEQTEAAWSAACLYAANQHWGKALSLYQRVYDRVPNNYAAQRSVVEALLMLHHSDAAEAMANKVRNNHHMMDDGVARFEQWYEKSKQTRTNL